MPSTLAQRLLTMPGHLVPAEPAARSLHMALLSQLQMLAECIEAARQEIAAVGAEDIVGHQVPAARDELGAVILHTAEATGLILDACEALEVAVRGTAFAGTVAASTARIYEACAFQDITGQRLAKVVDVLRTIEAKVGDMVGLFGPPPALPASGAAVLPLLNGPQRAGAAMQQADVDALLESFE